MHLEKSFDRVSHNLQHRLLWLLKLYTLFNPPPPPGCLCSKRRIYFQISMQFYILLQSLRTTVKLKKPLSAQTQKYGPTFLAVTKDHNSYIVANSPSLTRRRLCFSKGLAELPKSVYLLILEDWRSTSEIQSGFVR